MCLAVGLGLPVGCTPAAVREAPEPRPTGMVAATTPAGAPEGLPAVLVRPDLQRLVEAGLDRRTGPLIDALSADDPAIRATAAHALASVQDPAAGEPLAALLGDPYARVRQAAAFALGQLRDAVDATALLFALRNESDPAVRLVLLEAIGKSGDAAALEAVIARIAPEGSPEDDLGAALALYHFGRRGVIAPGGGLRLLGLLAGPDERQAMTAALALAAPRGPAPWGLGQEVLRYTVDGMSRDRLAAGPLLGILARTDDEADLERFAIWLRDAPRWPTRVAAANALGRVRATAGSADAVHALMAALSDASVHVATAAAEALAGLNRDRVDGGVARLGAWMRAHPERPAVAAALLPALVGSPDEALVLAWARGEAGAGYDAPLAWPALALVGAAEADSILVAGLRGARREAYVAAAALADRLEALPAEATLRDTLVPVLIGRMGLWGPHAPGSDLRGLLRLIRDLSETRPGPSAGLRAAAARHPHPEVRALSGTEPAEGLLPRRDVDWALLEAAGARPRLELTTARGAFVVELDPAAAPLAVSSLLQWAAAGRFDGLTFHRVEADFILQTGDIANPEGYGGPSRGLRTEITRLRYAPGVLGIASAGKDTEGSQFFITHGYSPSLDGRYGAVGRVVSGLDVAMGVALGDFLISVRTPGPDGRSRAEGR